MEKVKRLVILILFFVLGITMVNAQNDIFEYAWSKEAKSIEDNLATIFTHNKIDFKNGYVITAAPIMAEDSYTYDISYYNYKGELIKSKKLENRIFTSIVSYDNYIYALSMEPSSDSTTITKIVKLDENLNIVAEKTVSISATAAGELLAITSIAKYIGYNIISTENDEITIFGAIEAGKNITRALFHYDLDLKQENIERFDEYENEEQAINSINKYYPFIGEYISEYESMEEQPEVMTILSDQNGSKKVYNGANLSQCEGMYLGIDDESSKAHTPCYVTSAMKLTNDNQVIFEKEYEDYSVILNAKIIGNYIVAIGIENLGDLNQLVQNNTLSEKELIEKIKTEILVFNMQGEIIQTIKVDGRKYLGIVSSNAGFIVNKFDINITDDDMQISMEAEAYNLLREVMTKITGKGNISVANTSIAGDNVTYVITPEKGYVLGKVIITDENGNVIETTNNTFTMPSAAVTIDVEFLPENPETRDIAVIAFGIVLLLGTILTLVNYKRLKTIR